MPVVEEFLRQSSNLKNMCEQIRGARISDRSWYDWERLCGAVYNQGQKIENRKYSREIVQMFLCLAWWRKNYPRKKVCFSSLRAFALANEDKIQAVYNEVRNGGSNNVPQSPVAEKSTVVPLSLVKRCCDEIANRSLSRECWSGWKQQLGIKKYSSSVEDLDAALLVYMACWRQDNPKKKFPSKSRLAVMMCENSRRAMTIETASSSSMQHQWEMKGCMGREIPRYLAAHGYQFAKSTLYKWGGFKQRKHYSVAELKTWKIMAMTKVKKYGTY